MTSVKKWRYVFLVTMILLIVLWRINAPQPKELRTGAVVTAGLSDYDETRFDSVTPIIALDEYVQLFSVEKDGDYQMLLFWGDRSALFDWTHITPGGTQVAAKLIDLDADGADELILSILTGRGTGANYHELHVVEREGENGCLVDHQLSKDAFSLLSDTLAVRIRKNRITLSIGDQTLRLEAAGEVAAVTLMTEVVDFMLSDSGVTMMCSVPVEYVGNPNTFYVARFYTDIRYTKGDFVLSGFKLTELGD